jgi:hypothetical protein
MSAKNDDSGKQLREQKMTLLQMANLLAEKPYKLPPGIIEMIYSIYKPIPRIAAKLVAQHSIVSADEKKIIYSAYLMSINLKCYDLDKGISFDIKYNISILNILFIYSDYMICLDTSTRHSLCLINYKKGEKLLVIDIEKYDGIRLNNIFEYGYKKNNKDEEIYIMTKHNIIRISLNRRKVFTKIKSDRLKHLIAESEINNILFEKNKKEVSYLKSIEFETNLIFSQRKKLMFDSSSKLYSPDGNYYVHRQGLQESVFKSFHLYEAKTDTCLFKLDDCCQFQDINIIFTNRNQCIVSYNFTTIVYNIFC